MSILTSTATGAATVRPNSTFLSNYCAKSNRKIRVSYLNGRYLYYVGVTTKYVLGEDVNVSGENVVTGGWYLMRQTEEYRDGHWQKTFTDIEAITTVNYLYKIIDIYFR